MDYGEPSRPTIELTYDMIEEIREKGFVWLGLWMPDGGMNLYLTDKPPAQEQE